jgi:hypothetical protein
MLPPGLPLPTSLFWLGDRQSAIATQHATDAKGCVMYFANEKDCTKFMRWLTGYSGAPSLRDRTDPVTEGR